MSALWESMCRILSMPSGWKFIQSRASRLSDGVADSVLQIGNRSAFALLSRNLEVSNLSRYFPGGSANESSECNEDVAGGSVRNWRDGGEQRHRQVNYG